MDARDGPGCLLPVEAGDDQAAVLADRRQVWVDGRQADRASQPQAFRLGLDQAGTARVVDLEDVGRGPAVEGPAPAPLSEVDEEELVLQARQRELAVVMGAERVLVEVVDRLLQARRVVRLDPGSRFARLLHGNRESAGNVAAVAFQQPERVAGRQVSPRRQRAQRVALGEQAPAVGERGQGPLAQRQAAGDNRAVAGPPSSASAV